MLNDILRSCSNVFVAQAAVFSIGGAFATRVGLFAGALGLTAGEYAAQEISRFGAEAEDEHLAALHAAIEGADQPVLSGVQFILERVLENGTRAPRGSAAHARHAVHAAA